MAVTVAYLSVVSKPVIVSFRWTAIARAIEHGQSFGSNSGSLFSCCVCYCVWLPSTSIKPHRVRKTHDGGHSNRTYERFLLETDKRGQSNFYTCLLSLVFLFGTFLLDVHHYAVWWCYTPSIDTRCHCRSRKHKRYLPYHLAGAQQRKDIRGDRPCTTDPCNNRHLSHITIFHADSYKPQPRWSKLRPRKANETYVGFHTTLPKDAVSIAHSEFKPSTKGMLGKGVYFARSITDTLGKTAGKRGACIVAMIRMGRVFELNKINVMSGRSNAHYDHTLQEFVTSSAWHKDYDTCYMNHNEDESKDEFCIKDPKTQVIKWIVLVDKEYDTKVAAYGLDKEFGTTQCYCV